MTVLLYTLRPGDRFSHGGKVYVVKEFTHEGTPDQPELPYRLAFPESEGHPTLFPPQTEVVLLPAEIRNTTIDK